MPQVSRSHRAFRRWGHLPTGSERLVPSSRAGIAGFLANRKKLDEDLDEGNSQWEVFLQAWLDLFGTQWVRIADIIAVMNGCAGQDWAGSVLRPLADAFFETLPDALQLMRKEH